MAKSEAETRKPVLRKLRWCFPPGIVLIGIGLGRHCFQQNTPMLGLSIMLAALFLAICFFVWICLRRAIGVEPNYLGAIGVSIPLSLTSALFIMHAMGLSLSPARFGSPDPDRGEEIADLSLMIPIGHKGIPPKRMVLHGSDLHAVWIESTVFSSRISIMHGVLDTGSPDAIREDDPFPIRDLDGQIKGLRLDLAAGHDHVTEPPRSDPEGQGAWTRNDDVPRPAQVLCVRWKEREAGADHWVEQCRIGGRANDEWRWVVAHAAKGRVMAKARHFPLGLDELGHPVDKLIIDGVRPYLLALLTSAIPLMLALAACYVSACGEKLRQLLVEPLILNVIPAVPAIVWLIATADVLDVSSWYYTFLILALIGLLFLPQAYELIFDVLARYQRDGHFNSDYWRGYTVWTIFWRHVVGRLVLWARLLRVWAGSLGFAVLMDTTLNYLNFSPGKGSITLGAVIARSSSALLDALGDPSLAAVNLAKQNMLVFASAAGAVVLIILTFYVLSAFIMTCEGKLDV